MRTAPEAIVELQRLRDENLRLQSVLANVSPIVLELDEHGVVTLSTGRGLNGSFLSSTLIVGQSIFELGEEAQSLVHGFRNALCGLSFTSFLPIGRRIFEGHYEPKIAQGRIVGATAVFVDVTRRIEAQNAVIQSEQNFRALVESLPDGVLVHRFGRIVYCNQSGQRLLRVHTTASLIGKPILEIFQESDRESIAHNIRAAEMRQDHNTAQRTLLLSDGSDLPAEVTVMPLIFAGSPAIACVARDISERIRMQQKLMQTERLAALGTLAGGVGHEINNPLAYLVANLAFLSEEIPRLLPAADSEENADVDRAIVDARDGTERVRDIVRQLTEFTRVDDENSNRLDPRRAFEKSLSICWHRMRRVASVHVDLSECCPVRGSFARLGQVFLNLLLNAEQALRETSNAHVSIVTRVAHDKLNIEFSDNGPGIPQDIAAKVFDPFYSTKPLGQGTGLGLSVAHSIVANMGGTIEHVPSRMGASFAIRLPQAGPLFAPEAAGRVKTNIGIAADMLRSVAAVAKAVRGLPYTVAGATRIASIPSEAKDRVNLLFCEDAGAGLRNQKRPLTLFVQIGGRNSSFDHNATGSLVVCPPDVDQLRELLQSALEQFPQTPVGACATGTHLPKK